MTSTRISKIARLPRDLRQQLNERLRDGESGKALLAWLNAQPAVQTVLAAEFEGRPINAQNLSDWRRAGYRDWLLHQEALELAERLAEDTMELEAEGRPRLTDSLALWLAARYAAAARKFSQAEGAEAWRQLRELCGDIVELRRGDHSAERLRLERERLKLETDAEREKTEEEFWAWAMKVENRDRICEGHLCPEERQERLRQIFRRPEGSPPICLSPPDLEPSGMPHHKPGRKG